MKSSPSLDELRQRLARIDRDLLELVSRRMRLASDIGQVKRGAELPTRDFRREKEVMEAARDAAGGLGVPAELAESLTRLLIRSSLTAQEQDRVVAEGQGDGCSALVIGGAGKMGRWFAQFLASQGFSVTVADPAGAPPGFALVDDWRTVARGQDVVVVAAPLGATAGILQDLAGLAPRGLVFDIGSLKGPLWGGLEGLAAAGCRVTSLHPMFGPDTALLSGRHVIFVDVGVADATRAARELFAPTMAELVDMRLEDHDRLIAYVLGLSHVLNIAFMTVLAESGSTAAELARLSSTTFDAQLQVAGRVSGENPHLYYEIQALNAYGQAPLQALGEALGRIRSLVGEADEAGFVDLMEGGWGYVRDWLARQSASGK